MANPVTPMPMIRARFFDDNGRPLSGGKIYTYEPNSTTPKTTYKDLAATTPNTNPILLDVAGEADIYFDGQYRVIVESWRGEQLYDVDNVGALAQIKASYVVDASGKTQQEINDDQKNTNLLRLPVFSVKAFGAKGDGVTDDRAAIQAAIDACINNGGGVVYFPSTGDDFINGASDYTKFYAIKSTHPDYLDSGLVVKLEGSQYVRGNIKFLGEGYNSRIQVSTVSVIDHCLAFKASTNNMQFEGMYIEGNRKCKNALYMSDNYHPYLTMTACTYRGGTEYAARISTYVASFSRVLFLSSGNGVKFSASVDTPTGPVTSLTMNSCYANGNDAIGYDLGYLTYCTFNSCAADNNDIGYNFSSAYGVSMNACGSEATRKPIKVAAFRGFAINTFYGLSCGSADAANPTDYLIELVAGLNATVAGIQFANTRNIKYILGLTDSSYGSENITVLDRSVVKSNCYWVSNYNFSRPIKFLRDDQTEVARTYDYTNVAELKSLLNGQYRDFNIDHTITVNLANGTYNLAEVVNIYRVGGRGELIIQGNSSDRSLVKIDTGIINLRITDCSVRIVFKDLTLMSTASNNGAIRLLAVNSPNVVLDNCVLEQGAVNTGYGVSAQKRSRVSIINNTIATGAFASGSFIASDTSEILIPNMSAPPASGTWTAGMRIYNSAPTTYIGWVYSGGAWKTYGAIV